MAEHPGKAGRERDPDAEDPASRAAKILACMPPPLDRLGSRLEEEAANLDFQDVLETLDQIRAALAAPGPEPPLSLETSGGPANG